MCINETMVKKGIIEIIIKLNSKSPEITSSLFCVGGLVRMDVDDDFFADCIVNLFLAWLDFDLAALNGWLAGLNAQT